MNIYNIQLIENYNTKFKSSKFVDLNSELF